MGLSSTLMTLCVATTLSCATSYEPARSPRVTLVRAGSGGVEFVRNGRYYAHGFFGGGLAKAVSGVPRAESHARSYVRTNAGGFFTMLGGAVAIGGGVSGVSGESQSLSDGLIVGGLALELLGAILYATAPAHLWDAVNSHNDEVQRRAVERWRANRRSAPAGSQPAQRHSPR